MATHTLRRRNLVIAAIFLAAPLLVWAWTSIPALAGATLWVGLLLLIATIGLGFIKRDSWQLAKVIIQVLTVLFLVGATNWFLSPFFFMLYLVPLYLGFLYVPAVAFAFLASLLIIFASSVGEVDLALDIMTLLSLLLVIPLVIYLRKKYLVLRQTSKDILILEDESGIKSLDTIGKLLANRITNLGVTVRQPLTFIKQAATILLEEELNNEEQRTYTERIRSTAAETLEHVRRFEGDTSANVVISHKRRVSKPGMAPAETRR